MTNPYSKQQQATAKISELLQQARALIEEAQKVADEANIEFDFSVAYGMGGTYYPKNAQQDWESSDCYNEDDRQGWVSSSQDC